MSHPLASGGWFHNRRTGLKMSMVVAVALSVAFAIAIVSLIRLSETNASLSRLADKNMVRLQLFGDIRGGQAEMNNGAANIFAPEKDPVVKARIIQDGRKLIQEGAAKVDAALALYGPLAKDTPAQETVTHLQSVWPIFHNGEDMFILGEAPKPGVPVMKTPAELATMTQKVDGDVAKLSEIERADGAAVAATARHTYQETVVWIVVALLAGVLLAIVIATLVVLAITRRIRSMADSLNRVAEGDLTVHAPVTGHDEVGEMAAALNKTVDTIHDLICQIGSDADSLSETARRAAASEPETGRLHLTDAGTDPQTTERHLAEMAENLNVMISMFVTRPDQERAPAA